MACLYLLVNARVEPIGKLSQLYGLVIFITLPYLKTPQNRPKELSPSIVFPKELSNHFYLIPKLSRNAAALILFDIHQPCSRFLYSDLIELEATKTTHVDGISRSLSPIITIVIGAYFR